MNKDDLAKMGASLLGHVVMSTSPAVTLSHGGLGLLQTLGRRRAYEKAQRAYEALVREIAAVKEFAPEADREALVSATLEQADEATIDAFLEGFRDLLGALDPKALPYIARLTATYICHGRARDRFFRSVGGLLAEATAETVDDLVRLADAMREAMNEFGGLPLPDFIHLCAFTVVVRPFMPGYNPNHAVLDVEVPEHEPKQIPVGTFRADTTTLFLNSRLSHQAWHDADSTRFEFSLADTKIVNAFVELFSSGRETHRAAEEPAGSE